MKIFINSILLACIVGCSSYPVMPTNEVRSSAKETKKVLVGDILKIDSQGDQELTGNFTVQDDGTIFFPYTDGISVLGKTTDDVSANVKSGLMKNKSLNKDYIKDLKISTQVVESKTSTNKSEIKVVGEVKNSSSLSYWDGMRVLDAITKVGGTTFESHLNYAILYRRITGEDKMYGVHLKDIYLGDMETNYFLQPGDTIIVPRDPLPVNTTIDVSAVLTLLGLAGI